MILGLSDGFKIFEKKLPLELVMMQYQCLE